LSERLRIKLLKNPPKPIQTISARDIGLLMAFKPSGRIQIRTWTLAVLLLDCGLRIDEALGLERANVDLDALTLRVLGNPYDPKGVLGNEISNAKHEVFG